MFLFMLGFVCFSLSQTRGIFFLTFWSTKSVIPWCFCANQILDFLSCYIWSWFVFLDSLYWGFLCGGLEIWTLL